MTATTVPTARATRRMSRGDLPTSGPVRRSTVLIFPLPSISGSGYMSVSPRWSIGETALVRDILVSRAGSPLKISGERIEDLLRALLPHEWLGVVVPGLGPRPDVGFQGLHAPVGTPADLLIGEEAKPPLDLVQPGGAGRGEVQMDPGVPGEPPFDSRGLVGAVVVADDGDGEALGHGLVDGDQVLLELGRPVMAVQLRHHPPLSAIAGRERGDERAAGGLWRRVSGAGPPPAPTQGGRTRPSPATCPR